MTPLPWPGSSSGQRSLLRGLLSAVYQAAMAAPGHPRAVKAELRSAWSLLATLDHEHPAALDAVAGPPLHARLGACAAWSS